MKVKIVYYSLEGSTRLISDEISKRLNADVLELKPVKEYPNSGFSKYLWGGRSVITKEKPQLETYSNSIEDYDLIIIGTPIWAGTFAPPIRTYLTENDLSGKKIAFFVCHGGGGEGRCFKEFEAMQPNCELISTIALVEPIKSKNAQYINNAILWAEKLV